MMRAEDMKPGMWVRRGHGAEQVFRLCSKKDGRNAWVADTLTAVGFVVEAVDLEPWKPRVGEWVRCVDVGASGFVGRVTSVYTHSVLVDREVASRLERCEPIAPPETATPKPEAPGTFPEGGPRVGDVVRWTRTSEEPVCGPLVELYPMGSYSLGRLRSGEVGAWPHQVGVCRLEFISRPNEAARARVFDGPHGSVTLVATKPVERGEFVSYPSAAPVPVRPDNGKCSCCGGPAYVGLNEVTCLAAKCEPPVTEPTISRRWLVKGSGGLSYDVNADEPGCERVYFANGRGKSATHPTRAGAIAAWKALVGL